MDMLVLFGPAASGKMSVGRRIAERTRYRLFHNHMTIEPLLGLWDFSHPSFQRISSDLRRSIVREAVQGDTFDLIFTFVWSLDDESDDQFLASLCEPVQRAGGVVRFAELVCSQAVRLRRNRTEERLDHKRSKRDLSWSDANLARMDERYRLQSTPGEMELRVAHYSRVDNESGTPEDAARQIIEDFGLPETPDDE